MTSATWPYLRANIIYHNKNKSANLKEKKKKRKIAVVKVERSSKAMIKNKKGVKEGLIYLIYFTFF